MKIVTSTNNQGLELKVNKFTSGQFKWAANVKDRFDPIMDEHVLINRYRTSGGSEMEVFITSRIPFVNMVGTGLGMGYMKFQLLEHKLNRYGFKQF